MKSVFVSFYLFLLFTLLFVQFGVNPLLDMAAKRYFHDGIVTYNREISRGAFHMMIEDLQRVPSGQWQDRIEELQQHHGYDIALHHPESLNLTSDQLEQLRQGQIAVDIEANIIYRQIDGSSQIISMGPFTPLEPETGAFLILVFAVLIVLLACFTLIWIIPFWRKLKKISSTAKRFGEGDFSVRTNLWPRSALAPIAQAFDTMADRIGELIRSHKELTNAVSHELRTPISRLRFGLEMLDTSDEEKKRIYRRGLEADIDDLEELVSELLSYARFDRESPSLEYQDFPVQTVIEEIMTDLQPMNTGLNWRIEQAADMPLPPRADRKQMTRALANLVQNALKYSDGQVVFRLSREGSECRIDIDDDGPGVKEEDRQRIFAPFTRLNSSRSRSSGGYGLGLAIVKKILFWHGGDVMAHSSPLGGARFHIHWPGFDG